MTLRISQHISYAEAIHTDTGLKNEPIDDDMIDTMRVTAFNVFEPVRVFFNVPIAVNSFFRSPEVNYKIHGASSSQHMKGEAIDIDAHVYGGVTNKEIFHFIREHLTFDQLIWESGTDIEPNWIHVSFTEGANRMQVLKMRNGIYWKI